jgi:hypothetical protein
MSRRARYNGNHGTYDKRDVPCAAQDHGCFAACGAVIPKGEFYIQDKRTRPTGNFGNYTAETVIILSWHMGCAPLTKAAMKQSMDLAILENAKEFPKRVSS